MRKVFGRGDFASWFARLLSHLAQGEPAPLFSPAFISDRSGGKIAHLDGLNLSRAWCWKLIVDAVDDESTRSRIDKAIDCQLGSASACDRRLHGRALAGEFRPARNGLRPARSLTKHVLNKRRGIPLAGC